MSVLATGNLREGFKEYEKRTPLLPASKHQNMAPRWDGARLDGSAIMLWAEQGFGDTIQFARYAKLVAERGGRVLISVQRPLIELFRTCSGVAGIMMRDDLPNLRAQYPLLGLPHLLGTNALEDIPADVPYLFAETGRIETWRERIGESDGKLRVGLAWAADPKGGSAQRKSCPPELLAPLLDINGVQFISLQKTRDPSAGDLPHVIDLTAQLEDFADTAALVHHLDLVISIDTAVCHLAGAMGKPVWTLLPYSPDWRWLFDRSDTPWYPTMRLFRQPAPLDWKSVIDSVAMELRERAKSRSS
jgi:hypothetical protein